MPTSSQVEGKFNWTHPIATTVHLPCPAATESPITNRSCVSESNWGSPTDREDRAIKKDLLPPAASTLGIWTTARRIRLHCRTQAAAWLWPQNKMSCLLHWSCQRRKKGVVLALSHMTWRSNGPPVTVRRPPNRTVRFLYCALSHSLGLSLSVSLSLPCATRCTALASAVLSLRQHHAKEPAATKILLHSHRWLPASPAGSARPSASRERDTQQATAVHWSAGSTLTRHAPTRAERGGLRVPETLHSDCNTALLSVVRR